MRVGWGLRAGKCVAEGAFALFVGGLCSRLVRERWDARSLWPVAGGHRRSVCWVAAGGRGPAPNAARPFGHQFGVQRRRCGGDRRPAELGHCPLPARRAVDRGAPQAPDQRVQGVRQRRRVIRRDEQPRRPSVHDLGEVADAGARPPPIPARPSSRFTIPGAAVYRRAHGSRACVSNWMTEPLRQHLRDPRLRPDRPPGRTSAAAPMPRAHTTSCADGSRKAARSRRRQPLLAVSRPRSDIGPVRRDAVPGQHVRRGVHWAVSMPLRITRDSFGMDGGDIL